MNEKEKFEELLKWVEGLKENGLELFEETYCGDEDPFNKADLEILYNEIIEGIKAVMEGKKLIT